MIIAILAVLLGGSSAHAIIGGQKVAADDPIARSTVMLIGQTETAGFTCSGTILNSKYILTAAHCVLNVKSMFILFTTDAPEASLTFLLKDPTKVRMANSVRHNIDYPNTPLGGMYPHNDVGLVRFDGGIPAGYTPVTILDPAVIPNYMTANQPVVIAGYGRRSVGDVGSDSGYLYRTTLPFKNAFGKDAEIGAENNVACSGDSGGPAFIVVNGKYYQWGIASRSNCKTVSIYTPLKSNFYGQMARP